MAAHTSQFLFVYGSLRSGFQSEAYAYISRHFNFIGEASVKGKLFDTGDYPAAVPATTSYISGELYAIKNEREFSWAIAQLDDYEGVVAEENEPALYRRELTEVYLNNSSVIAWIYWYNGDVAGRPVIDSGDIMDYWKKKDQAK